MTKILYLTILVCNFYFSQNLHIEYINKNSEFTSFKENLYITDKEIVSIRDSVTLESIDKNPKITGSNQAVFFVKDKLYKISYFKKSDNKSIIIKDYIDDKPYYINDELPKIIWNTDYSETKNILGYECNKATTVFRGSPVTAYYTKQIKISSGPYKFGGIEGLILEIFENNSTINSWKAVRVENLKRNEVVTPALKNFNNIITLREFLALSQKKIDDDFEKMVKKLPKDVVINRNKIERTGIEKKYEWEN